MGGPSDPVGALGLAEEPGRYRSNRHTQGILTEGKCRHAEGVPGLGLGAGVPAAGTWLDLGLGGSFCGFI